MKRLLITGGSSYLGQHLVPSATGKFDYLYTYFSQDPLHLPEGAWLDIRDNEAVSALVHDWRPDVIIHTAGSNRSEEMAEVICKGAANITDAAKGVGARLVHISTDVIFDGTKAPYHESDPPSPIHNYGRAKSEAERTVLGYDNHVIIRTSLIYGLKQMDLSTKWIVTSLSAGETVTLFRDQIRNPVWIKTLTGACLELSLSRYTGILNIAGRQSLNRAEFGLKLLDWWGIEAHENLVIDSSGGKWPVDCRLDLSKAMGMLNTPLPGVDEVLDSFREN